MLKEEWGFEGVVVGDAEGVVELVRHGVAAQDEGDAVALPAGVDVEMGGHVVGEDGEPFVAPTRWTTRTSTTPCAGCSG